MFKGVGFKGLGLKVKFSAVFAGFQGLGFGVWVYGVQAC